MTILTLDLATRTGWALGQGRFIMSGFEDFKHNAARESPGMRFLRFANWLKTMIADYEPGLVEYEQPHQREGAATAVLSGFVGVLQVICAERDLELGVVHSRELKKMATGKGNADKEAMLHALRSKAPSWGWRGVDFVSVVDDNEVDALWLLRYAQLKFDVK